MAMVPLLLHTSYWHRCAKCKGALYGVPLFLLVEFLPITVFYVLVVMFQVKLTSPPMPCFIMLAQFYTIGFEVLHWIGKTMPIFETEDGHIRLQDVKISHVFYSIFNLDMFLSIQPPFCISSKLKFFHVVLLGYISAFYPLFLIGLTWLCVELHGRNYRLMRWLWKPFQTCCVKLKKLGWNTKSDLVDVFATFFLLSYNKCIYQTQMYYTTGLNFVLDIDECGNHFSLHKASIDGRYTRTYFCLFIPILIVSALFCILPPVLCYPFRLFPCQSSILTT